ncbi:MAG: hypothetical protein R3281_01070 [Balneolaceae bacterium]|nr:hypothetical protein [Balneolaceae bacterium]
MRKLVNAGIVTFLFLFTTVAFGQSEEANYLKFDYVKVDQDKVYDYISYMRNTWIPLYQEQVKNGTIDSWSLYRVFTPGGAAGKYNFVVITSAASLEPYESMRPRDILSMSQKNQQEIRSMMSKANSMRTLMYTEFWKTINKIDVEGTSPHPSKYMMIDFMNVVPGKEYDYQMLEDEIAKPIHQERKDKNRMAGWELFTIITPAGEEYGYNFATGNYFEELENVEFGFTEDVIQNALPGTDIPELFDTIFSTRSLVHSQVWELVERVD